MKQPKWIVKAIEGKELSVIWSAFRHGQISWGWDGPEKIIIHVMSEALTPKAARKILKMMRLTANQLADDLNLLGIKPSDITK